MIEKSGSKEGYFPYMKYLFQTLTQDILIILMLVASNWTIKSGFLLLLLLLLFCLSNMKSRKEKSVLAQLRRNRMC